MRSHSCVLALLATVLWLALSSGRVAGETRIEVDENGDEYELKRFYIQGRQLNGQGSKSQCIVTRRKRASRGLTLAQPSVSVDSQTLSLSAVPSVQENAQDSTKRRYVALAAVQLEEEDDDDEDLEDDDEEEVDDDNEEEQHLEVQQLVLAEDSQKQQQPNQVVVDAVQQKQFPVSQNPNSFLAATYAQSVPGGVSVVANAATHANVVGDGGIVVVESQHPPKVNPNTHAVFELKPLNHQAYFHQQDLLAPEDEDDIDDDDSFYYQGLGLYDEYEHFISEDSPVSTEAIWSTDGDEVDARPVKNQANLQVKQQKKRRQQQKRRKQQAQAQKQQQLQRKKQQQKKKQQRPAAEMDSNVNVEDDIKRKQQQEQQLSVASDSSVDIPKPTKKPASGSDAPVKRRQPKPKQQKKKKKKNSSSSSLANRRRRPSQSSVNNYGSMGGYRRRRPQQTEAQRRRRQQQKRRRQQLQRQRRRRNRIRQQNGNGYRRQYFDDEPIVNCIYINKDPVSTTTTTTPRPFWNLLGRGATSQPDATSQPRRVGEFGHRKRTNLKFAA